MADNKKNPTGRYYLIKEGYYEYPWDPGVKSKMTHGKWGTPTKSGTVQTSRKPALRKKR